MNLPEMEIELRRILSLKDWRLRIEELLESETALLYWRCLCVANPSFANKKDSFIQFCCEPADFDSGTVKRLGLK